MRSFIQYFGLFILLFACIEPISFEPQSSSSFTVVEGMISDQKGPHIISVTSNFGLGEDSIAATPTQNAVVQIHDLTENESIRLVEISPGKYATDSCYVGIVNHEYQLTIETEEGTVFTSNQVTLLPSGEILDVKYEFDSREIELTNGVSSEPYSIRTEYFFHIYVDAEANGEDQNYVRWKFSGTYKYLTYPQFKETWVPPYLPYKDPPPCSGYIVIPFVPGGKLEKVGPCTCCECWNSYNEELPNLSDIQRVQAGQFRNIKVGEVPVNGFTFYEKYRVKLEQMSLSKDAFDFFQLIREQKESASSIFQPPFGELKGNIESSRPDSHPVVGLFWASEVNETSIYLYPDDVPINITPPTYIRESCLTVYPTATTVMPAEWEE